MQSFFIQVMKTPIKRRGRAGLFEALLDAHVTRYVYVADRMLLRPQRQNDVVSTSMRRDHVASTLIRRNFDVVCLLGYCAHVCETKSLEPTK